MPSNYWILLPSLKDESDLVSSLILCEWSGVNSELRTVVLCLIKSDKIWEQITELVSLLLIWVREEKCVELQQIKENFINFFWRYSCSIDWKLLSFHCICLPSYKHKSTEWPWLWFFVSTESVFYHKICILRTILTFKGQNSFRQISLQKITSV